MDTILIGISKTAFNALYKYDEFAISWANIIRMGQKDFLRLIRKDPDWAIQLLEDALPFFELEEEAFLVEVEGKKIDFLFKIPFHAVVKVIPLNGTAKELLEAKLPIKVTIAEALSDALYEKLILRRQLRLRRKAADQLLGIFDLHLVKDDAFIKSADTAIEKAVLKKPPGPKDSTLVHLLQFNKTPSSIPSGNIEGLFKIIGTGFSKRGVDIAKLKKSPSYRVLMDSLEDFNDSSIADTWSKFREIQKEHPAIFNKLREELKMEKIDLDTFLFIYVFFTLKKSIINAQYDLHLVESKINELYQLSSNELTAALYLLGMVFSYDRLHDFLQFGQVERLKRPNEYFAGTMSEEILNKSAEEEEDQNYTGRKAVFFPDPDRIEAFKKAKRENKGKKYSKTIDSAISKLIENKPNFTYKELQYTLENIDGLLTRSKKLRKIARDYLGEFKFLEQ